MAKNFIEKGDSFDVILSAVQAPGSVGVFGDLVGVYETGGVIGDNVAVQLTGVWQLPKLTTTGQGAVAGTKVYWDPTAGSVTITAGSLKKIGNLHAATLDADTVCNVRLLG